MLPPSGAKDLLGNSSFLVWRRISTESDRIEGPRESGEMVLEISLDDLISPDSEEEHDRARLLLIEQAIEIMLD